MFKLKGSRVVGASLLEMMIGLGILGITATVFAQMMLSQSREIRATTEKLATMDFQRQLLSSITPSVCTWHIEQISPAPTINTQSASTLSSASITLDKLYMSASTSAPVLVQTSPPLSISPIAPDIKPATIQFRNFSGSGDSFTAQLVVEYAQSGTIRRLAPAILPVAMQTDPSSPANAKILKSCSLVREKSQPGTILVKHSQTTSEPDCPQGYLKLWGGYSFAGMSMGGYGAAHQDLGKTGSCLQMTSWQPLPYVECAHTNAGETTCKRPSEYDFAYWLSGTTINSPNLVYPTNTHAQLEALISRCSVCKSNSPRTLIVKHRQNGEIGADNTLCPPGSNYLWSGYSLMAAMGGDTGEHMSFDMSSTGSCLEVFRPIPFTECELYANGITTVGRCDFMTAKDFAYWLTGSPPFQRWNNLNPPGGQTPANNGLRRCLVCEYAE